MASKKVDMRACVSGGQRGSCVVWAMAHAFGLTYENANGIAHQFGRKQNSGMYRKDWLPMLKHVAKAKKRALLPMKRDEWPGKTVKTMARNAGRGKYIVHVKGHMLTVVDGEVRDWTAGRCHRVTDIWMVI